MRHERLPDAPGRLGLLQGTLHRKERKKTSIVKRQKNASAEKSDVQVVPNQELTDDVVEEIERDFIPGVMSYTKFGL